jgi:hypothetical protein
LTRSAGRGLLNIAHFVLALIQIREPAGTITGFYVDNNNVYHGFLRTRQGEFERFNAPGAGTGAWQGTQPMTISSEGTITGFYTDANNVVHGFLWMPR